MFRTIDVGTTIHRTDLYILVQVVNQRLALSLEISTVLFLVNHKLNIK